MKVLIVKTSSMGDVIHTLPALEDAYQNNPNIKFDWLVEPGFSEIPLWHPSVNKVIKLPLRQWRKNFFKYILNGEIKNTIKEIRQEKYDKIIDAQCLFKSAIFAFIAKGYSFGLDKGSAREGLASIFYTNKVSIDKNQHAVTRNRKLFAKALGYSISEKDVNYGLNHDPIKNYPDTLISDLKNPFIIFFHGTTWDTKHWPVAYWQELGKLVTETGYNIYVTWATPKQKEFAENFAKVSCNIIVLPTMNLAQAAKLISHSNAVVGVDTGFCHLSAALDKYTISIFGATDPVKSRPLGKTQDYIKSNYQCSPCMQKTCKFNKGYYGEEYPPCYKEITPQIIFEKLKKHLGNIKSS